MTNPQKGIWSFYNSQHDQSTMGIDPMNNISNNNKNTLCSYIISTTLSTSDVKIGKKKTTVKFPFMLCEGDHYSHLCPHMDEASFLLEKLQLPKGYHKLSPNPSLVDGPVNPVDQVVNIVSSSVEPLTKVVDPTPSSIGPTFHLESETQVTDLVPSLASPTLHLKSVKVVAPITSSVNPTLPLMSSKVVSLVTSSVNPTLPLKSAKVVDPISSSIDPTLPLESKTDYAHIFLVDTGSTMLGGIPCSLAKTLPSNEAILFYWGVIIGPRLPSHVPFKIIVKVCGQDVPHTLIDEGSLFSILSSISWQALGYPKLVLVT
jgi:hypothetical protein